MKKNGKKSRRPVNLDELGLRVIEVDSVEVNEFRNVPIDDRPISEVAMKMAAEMKRGAKIQIPVASDRMVLTTRRLLMYELDRIVAGSNLAAQCIENGTLLTFRYVKRA